MAIFASITAMVAADDGTSLSTVRSALLQQRLMVWSTWYMEMATKRTCTVHDKSKEYVKKSTRVLCAWDSGSVTVLVTDLLTPTQDGIQCPGSMWKKYHPHRPEKPDSEALFVGGLERRLRRVRVKSNKCEV